MKIRVAQQPRSFCHVLILIAMGGAGHTAVSPSSAAYAKPPNIVLILIDDLGYGDVGCYGNQHVKTPHIDQLATEGLRFTDFHSNGPMCTPTRAALLTGRYQQRYGLAFERPLAGDSQYDEGLPLAALTLAESLHGAGYTCGMFGKWHLGYHPPRTPAQQGFDVFRGLMSGDGDHHSHIDRSGRKDWWDNDQIAMEPGYSVDLITDHSRDFIRQHRDRPFFLYVAHLAIHFPWQGPDDTGYRREGTSYHNLTKLGRLASTDVGAIVPQMIQAVDNSVGQIVATLRECGLAQNTLVFFTSDNGGYLNYSGGYHNISSNGPLRGQKAELYEGGHRVPAIAWWPGKIPPGRTTDELVATFDLYPTALTLAGHHLPPDADPLDGIDMSPILFESATLPERTLFWRIDQSRAARRGPWKLIVLRDGPPALYHLGRDLGEQQDVAGKHPEMTRQLLAELTAWEADVDTAAPD